MKKKIVMTGIGMMLALCFTAGAFAQGAGGSQSPQWWLIGTPLTQEQVAVTTESRPAIVTVQGTVVAVEDMKGISGSNQMRLKTAQGDTWVVFMGPRWFVDNQRMKFNPGDQVEVRGAKFLALGQSNIVAADISKSDMTMKLRNEDGLPSWECCFPRKPSRVQ